MAIHNTPKMHRGLTVDSNPALVSSKEPIFAPSKDSMDRTLHEVDILAAQAAKKIVVGPDEASAQGPTSQRLPLHPLFPLIGPNAGSEKPEDDDDYRI